MTAVELSQVVTGPGWMAVLAPGRIQVRLSPDAAAFPNPDADAINELLPPEVQDNWMTTYQYTDEYGWDVYVWAPITVW